MRSPMQLELERRRPASWDPEWNCLRCRTRRRDSISSPISTNSAGAALISDIIDVTDDVIGSRFGHFRGIQSRHETHESEAKACDIVGCP